MNELIKRRAAMNSHRGPPFVGGILKKSLIGTS